MPRSYRKNIIRTFRSTKSRFIAIFSIVALGVGFLAGLMSSTPDMKESMEAYLDDANFYDLHIVSTLGLTQDDLEALQKSETVHKAQFGYSLDLLVVSGEDTLVARAQSLPADPEDPDAINKLSLVEGNWPQKPGECVVALPANESRSHTLEIGDTFHVSPDNKDLSDALERRRFTVVGRVRSPGYFSIQREAASVGDGSVALFFYLQPSDFAYDDVYTDLYVTLNGAFELLSFEDPYKDFVDEAAETIEDIGATRCEERYQELYDEARADLDDGWKEYNDAREEADRKFADAEKELADARQDLDDAEDAYHAQEQQLESTIQLYGGNEALFADARRDLEAAWQQIQDGRQELADNEDAYRREKADAEKELNDARADLEDGEEELADLEKPEWYITDRSATASFNSFDGSVTKVEAISHVFPVFFFLVAALVVSTTMTRMVEEERLQIGTMKALGYDRSVIMQKYIGYALTAAVLGALVGLSLGFVVFPSVIWYAYEMMYYMPHLSTPWRANYAILAGGLLIGCTLITTISACWATLRETPASLMRPRAPKAGRRIFLEHIKPLWRRMPFTYKVTCRNLLRYKKRFWMTVIGVAGCTSLLVTGFGIADSLDAIAIKQYGEIYKYDLLTAVTDAESAQNGEIYDYLFGSDAFQQSLAASTELVKQRTQSGEYVEVYLLTPQSTDRFNDFVDLHERVSKDPVPFADNDFVLTEKLAKTYGVKEGDTVSLENSDGKKAEFTVTGICEHYVMNYAYIGPASYREAYGADPEWNTVMSLLNEDSEDSHAELSDHLLRMDGVASVNFTTDQRTSVLNMLESINAVVVLIIVCAAGLAFVVLYNLTNINIAERVKEIATIKVLGFYDREVSAYVNRESSALTVIGTLLGLLGGIALHRFIITTVEVDAVMFGREIRPISFLYSLLLTLLFGAVVNWIMNGKLKKISMVESMKAPE